MSNDFVLEKTLRERSPELHKRFTGTVFALQNILSGYKLLFPEFTDHTELHSMNVADFCNTLLGKEQVEKMNADEIYVLLMACYLHDVGMGITQKDYEAFRPQIDMGSYLENHPNASTDEIVRDFHHEFSGLFIKKYGALFDIPSEAHLFAVVQTSRGHRKTDLFDEAEYPADLKAPNGNTICTPFLAGLIRLADEIDVTAARNSKLLYDIESMHREVQMWHALKHLATRDLLITPDSFTMIVQTEDERMMDTLRDMQKKMQLTLDYCRAVALQRSPYRITQTEVDIKRIDNE